MTRPKGSKGKSERRPGAYAGGDARMRTPGMPTEQIRRWFVRWGIIGKGRLPECKPTKIVLSRKNHE